MKSRRCSRRDIVMVFEGRLVWQLSNYTRFTKSVLRSTLFMSLDWELLCTRDSNLTMAIHTHRTPAEMHHTSLSEHFVNLQNLPLDNHCRPLILLFVAGVPLTPMPRETLLLTPTLTALFFSSAATASFTLEQSICFSSTTLLPFGD